MRHLTNRTWQNNARTTWVRRFDEAGQRVTYRMFRRSSVTRAFSTTACSFSAGTSRTMIAAHLRSIRRQLRERVDAYDLSMMGYGP